MKISFNPWTFPHRRSAVYLMSTPAGLRSRDSGCDTHAHAAFSREPAIRHRWGAREWDRGTQTWGGKRAKSVRVCPQQTRPSICWWHRSLTQTCPTSNPRRTPRCGSAPSPWVSAGMSAPRAVARITRGPGSGRTAGHIGFRCFEYELKKICRTSGLYKMIIIIPFVSRS